MNDLSFLYLGRQPESTLSRRSASWAAVKRVVVAALITCALPSADSTAAETAAAHEEEKRVSVVREADDGLPSMLALLARYDRGHDDRVLLQALPWFDRRWEVADERALAIAQPLHARVCGRPHLQWSWLCEPGE